jgi:hypothetical protein
MTPPPLPAARQRGWLGRNVAWVVSGGCLVMLGMGAALVWWVVSVVFGMMRSTEVYVGAVEAARGSEVVQERLGTPIEEGFFFSGNIQTSGASGSASLAIPLSGPGGKGTVYAEAAKRAGEWSYGVLVVEVDGTGERIDLLGGADEGIGRGD